MVRFRSGNHAIAAGAVDSAPTPSKRQRVYDAVEAQLGSDNKRPWKLDQKLNDAPYRYSRDSLRASLNALSARLAAAVPPLDFGVEGHFRTGKYASYAKFVEKAVKGTVSELINEVKDASR